jgi:hypothetical protein
MGQYPRDLPGPTLEQRTLITARETVGPQPERGSATGGGTGAEDVVSVGLHQRRLHLRLSRRALLPAGDSALGNLRVLGFFLDTRDVAPARL